MVEKVKKKRTTPPVRLDEQAISMLAASLPPESKTMDQIRDDPRFYNPETGAPFNITTITKKVKAAQVFMKPIFEAQQKQFEKLVSPGSLPVTAAPGTAVATTTDTSLQIKNIFSSPQDFGKMAENAVQQGVVLGSSLAAIFQMGNEEIPFEQRIMSGGQGAAHLAMTFGSIFEALRRLTPPQTPQTNTQEQQ